MSSRLVLERASWLVWVWVWAWYVNRLETYMFGVGTRIMFTDGSMGVCTDDEASETMNTWTTLYGTHSSLDSALHKKEAEISSASSSLLKKRKRNSVHRRKNRHHHIPRSLYIRRSKYTDKNSTSGGPLILSMRTCTHPDVKSVHPS